MQLERSSKTEPQGALVQPTHHGPVGPAFRKAATLRVSSVALPDQWQVIDQYSTLDEADALFGQRRDP
jgi:hypothetical protein